MARYRIRQAELDRRQQVHRTSITAQWWDSMGQQGSMLPSRALTVPGIEIPSPSPWRRCPQWMGWLVSPLPSKKETNKLAAFKCGKILKRETNAKWIHEAPVTWGFLSSCCTSAVMGESAMPNVLFTQIVRLCLFESCSATHELGGWKCCYRTSCNSSCPGKLNNGVFSSQETTYTWH